MPLVSLRGLILWGGGFRETLLDVTPGTAVGCSSWMLPLTFRPFILTLLWSSGDNPPDSSSFLVFHNNERYIPSFLWAPKSKSTQGCGNEALFPSPDKFLLPQYPFFPPPDQPVMCGGWWGVGACINSPAVMTKEPSAGSWAVPWALPFDFTQTAENWNANTPCAAAPLSTWTPRRQDVTWASLHWARAGHSCCSLWQWPTVATSRSK